MINPVAIRKAGRAEGGFTMVEIAISIAVVSFALVAILGILPTGMTVQKDNREDTIVNQEGRYWLELIKSGARGMNELTNYVEEIKFEMPVDPKKIGIVSTASDPWTGQDIIGLLTQLKYKVVEEEGSGNLIHANVLENGSRILPTRVSARVQAITGLASEKGTNANSFRYELQVEITPESSVPLALRQADIDDVSNPQRGQINRRADILSEGLHDLRVVIRWPVVERGTDWIVGNNKKVFRAKIAGDLHSETGNDLRWPVRTNYFSPNVFHAGH